MVVDFLSSKNPKNLHEVPTYVRRAAAALPCAWTTDLDYVARQRAPVAPQAVFALSLQTAALAAQVVRDAEASPSKEKLQIALDTAIYERGQIFEKAVAMEKDFLAEKKTSSEEIAKLKAINEKIVKEAELVRQKGEACLADLSARLKVAETRALVIEHKKKAVELEKGEADRAKAEAEQKAASLAKDFGAVTEELDRARKELELLKAKPEDAELDPFTSLECVSDFAYYLAYSDAIRAAAKGGLQVGPIVDAFKAFVVEHPLELVFMVPILDLSSEYGIDLSWYPVQENLVPPPSTEEAEPVSAEEPAPQAEATAGEQQP
ncbi:hypothetical protein OROGR_019040 [Orobanche gracilis]